MKNETQKFTEEELAARGEPPVRAKDLLAEIEPLMEDYFIGKISRDGESLTYSMPNGQKFLLTAVENC